MNDKCLQDLKKNHTEIIFLSAKTSVSTLQKKNNFSILFPAVYLKFSIINYKAIFKKTLLFPKFKM